jgi:hypothetical protein
MSNPIACSLSPEALTDRLEILEAGDTIEFRIDAPESEEMDVQPLFAPFLSYCGANS